MQKWLIKAFLQKAISYLPQAHKVNYQFQKLTTLKKEIPDTFFLDRLTHFQHHFQYFQQYFSGDKGNYQVLELGTGWHPIVPLGFYLSGAREIITLDIRHLINAHSLSQTIQKFKQLKENNTIQTHIPALKPERLHFLLEEFDKSDKSKPYDFLEKLNIKARKVTAKNLGLPTKSQEFIISNNVLQDIPEANLKALFMQVAEVAKPGCLMSHAFDMSDQFSHFDSNLTPFNYLQFSEDQWHFYTNGLQKQNRLRMPFYRSLFQNINLQVLEEVNQIGHVEDLRKVNLHPDFKSIPEEDTLIIHSHVVGYMH